VRKRCVDMLSGIKLGKFSSDNKLCSCQNYKDFSVNEKISGS